MKSRLLKTARAQNVLKLHIATKLNAETQTYIDELVSILERESISALPLAPRAELELHGRLRELFVSLKGNDVMLYADSHRKQLS